MSFWWKSCLWISHIYRRAGHVAKLFFSPNKCMISLLPVGLLFIPWLLEQFLSVIHFVSTEAVYSSPRHVGICQLFADETHLFLFQRQNQSYCKDSTCLKRISSGRKSSYLKLNLGKTEVALCKIPIFSRKYFPFLLVRKPSLWEFSHTIANFKGQDIGILTESWNSLSVCHLYPEDELWQLPQQMMLV